MTRDLAESLRCHRTIAVNHTSRIAPWADAMVALDGDWPQEWRGFQGIRFTGIKDDTLDALYVGSMLEMVSVDGEQFVIRNSGIAAIRIAAALGAKRIIVAGFAPENRGHFYDDEVDTGDADPYFGVAAAFDALVVEMAARGVAVERL
jgi:hypothetical protein